MRNHFWSMCGFFLLAISALAQEQPVSSQISLSLDEAIEFAQENSYEAINARRDVAKALKRKWEATADGLPQVNATVDYQNQLKQPVSFLPAAAFDPFNQIRNLEQYYNVTPNPDNPVPPPPEGFIPIVFSPQQQMQLTATLSQLIFDGSYLVGIEAAKSFLQFNNDSEEKAKLEVRKAVINAYGSVLVARESAEILQKNVNTLQKNYEETRKIYENGLATSISSWDNILFNRLAAGFSSSMMITFIGLVFCFLVSGF